jgi:hypothetical protein
MSTQQGSKEDAERYISHMVAKLLEKPNNQTAGKVNDIIELMNRPDIKASDVWTDLKKHISSESRWYQVTWDALQKYHSLFELNADQALREEILKSKDATELNKRLKTLLETPTLQWFLFELNADQALKEEILKSKDATELNERLKTLLETPDIDFGFSILTDGKKPSTGKELFQETLRFKLCNKYHTSQTPDVRTLTVPHADYITYYPPGQYWVQVFQNEDKYLETDSVKDIKKDGTETLTKQRDSNMLESNDEWRSNRLISSTSKVSYKSSSYRQVGYSNNDFINLGFKGKLWQESSSGNPQPTYTLEKNEVKITNESLEITNYNKIGFIDKKCIIAVQTDGSTRYFKPAENDQKIGYATLTSGDTLQERAKRVLNILIYNASMGYTDNLSFSYDLLHVALQGASTYSQKFQEMQNVITLANKVDTQLRDMEDYYVSEVKEIDDKYQQKEKSMKDQLSRDFTTRAATEVIGQDKVDTNYKNMKESFQNEIRDSVKKLLKQEFSKDNSKSVEEIMNAWTMPNATQIITQSTV